MPKLRDAEAISPAMTAMLGVSLAILFVPLVIIILLSFNTSPYGTLPFVGTFAWYVALFTTSGLLGPTWLSLELSFLVAISAAVFGTMSAVWLDRRASRIGGTIFRVALLSRDHRALAHPGAGNAAGDECHRHRPQPVRDLSRAAGDDAALCRLHRRGPAAHAGPRPRPCGAIAWRRSASRPSCGSARR